MESCFGFKVWENAVFGGVRISEAGEGGLFFI